MSFTIDAEENEHFCIFSALASIVKDPFQQHVWGLRSASWDELNLCSIHLEHIRQRCFANFAAQVLPIPARGVCANFIFNFTVNPLLEAGDMHTACCSLATAGIYKLLTDLSFIHQTIFALRFFVWTCLDFTGFHRDVVSLSFLDGGKLSLKNKMRFFTIESPSSNNECLLSV